MIKRIKILFSDGVRRLSSRLISSVFIASIAISSVPVYAQSNSGDVEKTLTLILDMKIKADGEDVELAHKWIKDIFGGFIYSLWGEDATKDSESITVLSQAIGYTNVLALFLGLIVIFYVLVGGALNTANEGEVLGKSWSSVWLPLRTALGFGLIMPAPGVGGGVFSVAQMFIVWLVLMGSNAATILWEKIVGSIVDGGNINAPVMGAGLSPSKEMLKMISCTEMYIRKKTLTSNIQRKDLLVARISRPGIGPFGDVFIHADQKTLGVGGFGLTGIRLAEHIKHPDTSGISFARDAACGSIEFEKVNKDRVLQAKKHDIPDVTIPITGSPTISNVYSPNFKVTAANYKNVAMEGGMIKAKEIVAETVDKLIDISNRMNSKSLGAMSIIDARQNGGAEDGAVLTEYNILVSEFSSVANNYSTKIVSDVHKAMTGSAAVREKWSNEMGKGGWMAAGMWFHEIGVFTSLSHQMINKINSSMTSKTPSMCGWSRFFFKKECAKSQEEMDLAISLADSMLADAITLDPESDGVTSEDVSSSSCTAGGSCGADKEVVNRISTSMAKMMLGWLANDKGFSSSAGITSPFETVTNIGHSINNVGTSIWAISVGLSITKGLTGLTKITKPLESVISYLMGTLAGLMVVLISLGFVLAYMIPFLPVVTWITMIAGYMLTIVEATIAAPLAIILMVTPEGEGISGTRLERAMQLLIMAIMKPSLMIIGLVASITISSVAFAMMNMFFFKAAEHVLKGGILDVLAVMVIYTMTALQLCKLLITIMYKLPDQILEWFSSGVGRQFGENETAGMMESSGNQMRMGVSQAVQGMNRAGGRQMQNPEKDKKEENQ